MRVQHKDSIAVVLQPVNLQFLPATRGNVNLTSRAFNEVQSPYIVLSFDTAREKGRQSSAAVYSLLLTVVRIVDARKGRAGDYGGGSHLSQNQSGHGCAEQKPNTLEFEHKGSLQHRHDGFSPPTFRHGLTVNAAGTTLWFLSVKSFRGQPPRASPPAPPPTATMVWSPKSSSSSDGTT